MRGREARGYRMEHPKVAVLGTGYWGQKHVEEFAASGCRVLAVDPRAEIQERVAQRFGAETAGDPEEAFRDPEVLAVTVCAPNTLHHPLARAALLAGKHVFVEKPLAMTVREGRELVALAQERRKLLVVGHLFRFNNAVRFAKQMMDYGEFGRAVLVKLTWANAEPLYADRDVIFDLGPHAFDVLHYLYGKHPDTLMATGGAFRRAEGPEVAFIQGRIENALYQFELSWLTPRKTRRLEVIGLRRSFVADLANQRVEVFENGGWRDANVVPNNTIRAELESFLAAIENRNAHIADGDIGVGNLEMLELARAALGKSNEIQVGG